jgi:hypothetical protein
VSFLKILINLFIDKNNLFIFKKIIKLKEKLREAMLCKSLKIIQKFELYVIL